MVIHAVSLSFIVQFLVPNKLNSYVLKIAYIRMTTYIFVFQILHESGFEYYIIHTSLRQKHTCNL